MFQIAIYGYVLFYRSSGNSLLCTGLEVDQKRGFESKLLARAWVTTRQLPATVSLCKGIENGTTHLSKIIWFHDHPNPCRHSLGVPELFCCCFLCFLPFLMVSIQRTHGQG